MKPTATDLPERYLRLARRQWEEDQRLDAHYDAVYRGLYSRSDLKERRFVNFGPGSFRHRFWRNADRRYDGKTWSEQRDRGYEMQIDIEWNLIQQTKVAVPDSSIQVVYCSHLVEHGWDDDVRVFMKEVHRILAKGGVFRITCPDTALGVRAMRRGDRFYFPKQGERPTSYLLLEHSSLITHPENPTRVRPEEADGFFKSFPDEYAALDEASRLSDRSLQDRIGAHVNWFTIEKLTRFLQEAGFSRIYRSGHRQSIAPILRDVRYFDKTDAEMSCYIDALRT